MKAEGWKETFRQKGWWKDGKIVLPPGVLTMNIGLNAEITVSAKDIKEATELYIMYENDTGSYYYMNYFLWEDISVVTLGRQIK